MRAVSMAAVTIHCGDIRTVYSVMLEPFVEGLDTHCLHPLADQIADGIVDHRGGDASRQAEAVGQVGGDVELTAADGNMTLGGLPKWKVTRIQAMNQRAEGQEDQGDNRTDVQTMTNSKITRISVTKYYRR